MKTQIQNLVKLLLDLHKALLGLQRKQYEKKNGQIQSNNDYFNIVVNHEDFKWLRSLSQVIALIDEEGEQEIINEEKVSKFLVDLKKMISKKKSDDFSAHYQFAISEDKNIAKLNSELKEKIKSILI
jgi:hypothetical protein